MQIDFELSKVQIAKFFAGLPGARIKALLLDYDGTLAPFRVDPGTAVPYPGVREVLATIRSKTPSRIILVSGRRAKEVNQLLGLEGIEIWGCHGMEFLSVTGNHQLMSLDSRTEEALSGIYERLLAVDLAPFIERKPTGYALHWRGLPADQGNRIREFAEEVWAKSTEKDVLRLLHFDGGIEICAQAMNKGDVVRQISAQLGESFAMAYLGDDVTDEDAFRALKGIGLSVLVREEYRKTNADAWIRPPQEVISFLESWSVACKGPR